MPRLSNTIRHKYNDKKIHRRCPCSCRYRYIYKFARLLLFRLEFFRKWMHKHTDSSSLSCSSSILFLWMRMTRNGHIEQYCYMSRGSIDNTIVARICNESVRFITNKKQKKQRCTMYAYNIDVKVQFVTSFSVENEMTLCFGHGIIVDPLLFCFVVFFFLVGLHTAKITAASHTSSTV